MIRHLMFAAVIGLVGTTGALAFPGRLPTYEKVVSAGHTLRVSSMSVIDQACHSLGLMTVNLIDVPHDGRVEVARGHDFPNFPTFNTRSRCNTRRLPATFVSYTPSPGYTGEDEFTIEFISPSGNVGRARFRLSVR